MEVVVKGVKPEESCKDALAGGCTEEPGDNCWLHLD